MLSEHFPLSILIKEGSVLIQTDSDTSLQVRQNSRDPADPAPDVEVRVEDDVKPVEAWHLARVLIVLQAIAAVPHV